MYIVIEIQTAATVSVLPFAFDNKQQAEAKYHQLLSVAATSSVPKHGAVMLTGEGLFLKSECYEHPVTE